MRLWHEALIPRLPRQQLLGQHRECCALRGLGWGKKHATVDYVFRHPYGWLVGYHLLVLMEMEKRGYSAAPEWNDLSYRGKKCEPLAGYDYAEQVVALLKRVQEATVGCAMLYPEHDDRYLHECLDNLAAKGVKLEEVKRV